MTTMTLRRMERRNEGDVTIIRLWERMIIDAGNIQRMGNELFSLVEEENQTRLILDFGVVEFISSACLNKFIILDEKVKAKLGKLVLCNIKPEIYEVFVIINLHKRLEVKPTIEEALATFA